MKIQEFRTGNIVNYFTAEGDELPSELDWQDFKWLDEDHVSFCLVHAPIKITEEIMFAAGFEKFYGWDDMIFFRRNEIEIEKVYEGFLFNGHYITTLHQLQNLYYSITGEELEIKRKELRS
jgi:hypothetical protein